MADVKKLSNLKRKEGTHMRRSSYSWLSLTLLVLIVGCGRMDRLPNAPLVEGVPASATTRAKTGVTVWQLQGSEGGTEVRGLDEAGKLYQSLSVRLRAGGSLIEKRYLEATKASAITLELGADGKVVSSALSGNPSDPELCPECMVSDLEAAGDSVMMLETSGEPCAITPLQTRTPCQKAQNKLARAAAAIVQFCFTEPVIPFDIRCSSAQAAYALAYQEFLEFCGNPFPTEPALRSRNISLTIPNSLHERRA
jgi:hypothetical protein